MIVAHLGKLQGGNQKNDILKKIFGLGGETILYRQAIILAGEISMGCKKMKLSISVQFVILKIRLDDSIPNLLSKFKSDSI